MGAAAEGTTRPRPPPHPILPIAAAQTAAPGSGRHSGPMAAGAGAAAHARRARGHQRSGGTLQEERGSAATGLSQEKV